MGQDHYLRSELLAEGRVLSITLDRQDNDKNQLNVPLVMALEAAFSDAAQQAGIRGLILRSAHEKVFSTGADIAGEMTSLEQAQAEEFSRHGHKVFSMLCSLPFPTVACIAGFCLGGGLELALCCDFRIAARNARLGLPEINLGLVPGWGGTQRLPRLLGRSRALRMILSGEPLNAESALEAGLVDELVESTAELEASALRLLARFSSKAARTLSLAKQAVYAGEQLPLDEALDNESRIFGAAWATAARREGISAFLEKRRPQWPED